MSKHFKNYVTIPNFMSLCRLAMVPVIMNSYLIRQKYTETVVLVAISGITDILDGIIARKFNMISDAGKILDPLADKITQIALILCLAVRYISMKYLVYLFAVKELAQAIVMFAAVKKATEVPSSKWFGKLSTVNMYVVCSILILIPNINGTYVNLMTGLCALLLMISLAGYFLLGLKLMTKKSDSK